MTKPRRKLKTRFHTFIVEPNPGFQPTNWQQTPKHYRILRYVGPEQFRGSADAWKFLHNHGALRCGNTTQWAIYLDFELPRHEQDDRFQPLAQRNEIVQFNNVEQSL